MADGQQNYFDPLVLARLSNLYLRARWVVEGVISGIHRSRARGFSVEFEEHREYSPGDELRRVDWKALGKFDRYFIKEYEDETNLRAYLLLDSSASMDYASNGITKFAYGCTLTASLAYLILKQQDAAGLVTFSNRVESFVPPKAKRGYLMEMLRALEASRPSGETKVGKILYEIAGQMKRRGLVVLVSDLLDDPEEILRGLRLFRLKGNDVIVFHPLSREHIAQIVAIVLRELMVRLSDEELTLKLTESASAFLVNHGYDEHFGARPLKRAIQRYIEDPLSEKILLGEFSRGDEIEVDMAPDGERLQFRALQSSKA